MNYHSRTDNPDLDFLRYDSDQQDELDKLPKCWNCEEPIQQEDAVCIDGDWICDRCLTEFRRDIEV